MQVLNTSQKKRMYIYLVMTNKRPVSLEELIFGGEVNLHRNREDRVHTEGLRPLQGLNPGLL